MNLLDILTEPCIKVPLEATDKQGCINELVDVLAQAGKVADPASLKDAVWAREMTHTTGIGHSLAIPHGKCDSVTDLAMAIGKPASPVDFQSIDNKPVKLIVLLASPIERTSDHIQALGQISRMLNAEAFRTQVYEAPTAAQVFSLLQQQELARAGA